MPPHRLAKVIYSVTVIALLTMTTIIPGAATDGPTTNTRATNVAAPSAAYDPGTNDTTGNAGANKIAPNIAAGTSTTNHAATKTITTGAAKGTIVEITLPGITIAGAPDTNIGNAAVTGTTAIPRADISSTARAAAASTARGAGAKTAAADSMVTNTAPGAAAAASPNAAGLAPPPQLTAQGAVLMDLTTGKVLYAKNPDEHLAPASTTKILTALIAMEKGHLNDVITVGPNPPRVDGTRVYLVEGEQVTLENLLYGMLLNSGNDAALAIAEYYGGSMAGFARLMNEKAAALGAVNSHFVTPNGLPDPNHYTTARDLAVIARAAMQNETFRRIVATKTRPWHGKEWETTLVNQNKLLWNYEGADGIKTGYTSEAHYTLVGSATRQGQTFIVVVLDEPGGRAADKDASALLDYGFNGFQTIQLVRRGEVVGALHLDDKHRVELTATGDLAIVRPKNDGTRPGGQLYLLPFKRPAPAGTRIGEIVFQQNGEIIGRVDVTNRQPIPARPLSPAGWRLLTGLVLALAYGSYRLLQARRQRRGMAASRVQSWKAL
ncbi:D-alanyl-D-alanine carboxypeptidase family protein [Moorella naiadis]|uniref:D-alanyl-D-alanine carboxypeptidase family protein n=1 Tax=Moorella naiadis (nom. illeg.) TaxID=3093670 RepID=UPI003D9C9E5E